MSPAPVIAVVGPSGVGKDSVMEALEARAPGIVRARRVITRPEGEEGEDFDRVSVEVFQQMAAEGAFALHWPAHGLFYGVPKGIDDLRHKSDAVLVNLSRAILLQAQEVFGDLIVISLTADPEVLAQRLSTRARECVLEQERRLARAAKPLPVELKRVIQVDNSGPLEATVAAILSQIQPERA
ncbi:phosphonate metabolism protein/1,5-bisphosphokinase (PRPP-forming) PhnN [Ruegeria arenilitoris]|uniref:phosphonate metabolism protein/1,5-bisphosphokinase (PRPP-forming) PhnN n=1 Tax=Ruegeria arenilitoris TaxID=1173585 RepID=UPI00147CF133|nr:phosphonate metabolism protein/1,5-bisphosphokinase (PRPP-forming) PhnN [Ruegeria arenilitoris]